MNSTVDRYAMTATAGAWIWFALMAGGWAAFWTLAVLADARLAELWHDLRDLPLVVEAVVWLALFPLVLATAVWESAWDAWLRLCLVLAFTVLWSGLFLPRRQPSSSRPSESA